MSLDKLQKSVKRGKKRLGQGHGSGKVKTSGRGTKGQKARGSIPQRLKLGGVSFVKRLPLFRGKSRNKKVSNKPLIVNLKQFADAKSKTVIDLEFLISNKLVTKDQAAIYGIKILGDGAVSVPLEVRLRVSNNAREKIEKAGGKVQSE